MAALIPTSLFTIMQCVISMSSVRKDYASTRLCIDSCEEEVSSYPLFREFRCRRVLSTAFRSQHHDATQDSLVCLEGGLEKSSLSSFTARCDQNQDNLPQGLTAEGVSVETLRTNPDKTLYDACAKGDMCTVQYILSRGLADINHPGKYGRTPVMVAARHGQEAVFDFLVSQGSDLSAVDNQNDTVLHLACKKGNLNIVRKLVVDRHYDMEVKGHRGWTPLIISVYNGHPKLFDLLVSTGSDPTGAHHGRKNLLHMACYGAHVDMIKHIVSLHIFDLESKGDKDKTALLYAVRFSFVQAVDFLVKKGSNVKAVDNVGNNILHTACWGGNVSMVKYVIKLNVVSLESRGVNTWTPLMMAAAKGHRKVFDVLLSKGCKLMSVDVYGETVLHLACLNGQTGIVKKILSHDKTEMESKDYKGRTPVMKAARHGQTKVVYLLVARGCNLKAVDYKGNNVLHVACKHGHVDVVKYLIKLEDVAKNCKNKDGRSPLQEAEIWGYTRVVSLLKSVA